jgi:DNA-binding beta-propeller fold protein YncE
VAVNQTTNTIYVVDYESGILSVIDGSTCNVSNDTSCVPVATGQVGAHPWRITVDAPTDTVYVTNMADDTVSVVNGATCNAVNTSGCASNHPVIHVGSEPEAVTVNDANHLAFVTNSWDNSVSVFDASTCDGQDTSGCGLFPATVRVGSLPAGIAVNPLTSTVYVADNDSNELAVFRATVP